MKLGDGIRALRAMFGGSGSSTYARQQLLVGDASWIHRAVLAEAGDDEDPDVIASVVTAIEVARGFREPTGDRYEGLARYFASLSSDMLDKLDELDDDDLEAILRDPEVAALIEGTDDGN